MTNPFKSHKQINYKSVNKHDEWEKVKKIVFYKNQQSKPYVIPLLTDPEKLDDEIKSKIADVNPNFNQYCVCVDVKDFTITNTDNEEHKIGWETKTTFVFVTFYPYFDKYFTQIARILGL